CAWWPMHSCGADAPPSRPSPQPARDKERRRLGLPRLCAPMQWRQAGARDFLKTGGRALNRIIRNALAVAAVATCAGMSTVQAQSSAPPTATVRVRADQPGPRIHRNSYGQFAEHLGRGIYEGVW